MGRNNKIGLQYFPVDVSLLRDRKIVRLMRHDADGLKLYLYLLCEIYSDKGYYMELDEDSYFDIADELRMEEQQVRELIGYMASERIALFDSVMLDQHHILTSRGIQERYIETISQLKRTLIMRPEYRISSEEIPESNRENGRNENRLPESSEERAISSEETAETSEEMPADNQSDGKNDDFFRKTSEETAIYSDKNKVKKSKVKEKDNSVLPSKTSEEIISQGLSTSERKEKSCAKRENPPSEEFVKFEQWVAEHAPRVARMRHPITEAEFFRLKHDYPVGYIQSLLLQMHNYKPLLSKYESANLTFRQWARRDKERTPAGGPQSLTPPDNETKMNLAKRMTNG